MARLRVPFHPGPTANKMEGKCRARCLVDTLATLATTWVKFLQDARRQVEWAFQEMAKTDGRQ
jgi:hypothetical protein